MTQHDDWEIVQTERLSRSALNSYLSRSLIRSASVCDDR
jgi:hypothetical protein